MDITNFLVELFAGFLWSSFGLSIVALCFALFSLSLSIRNLWVFNRRTELNRFENGIHVIENYADYDTMIRKFWIWDVEKFKLPNAQKRRNERKL